MLLSTFTHNSNSRCCHPLSLSSTIRCHHALSRQGRQQWWIMKMVGMTRQGMIDKGDRWHGGLDGGWATSKGKGGSIVSPEDSICWSAHFAIDCVEVEVETFGGYSMVDNIVPCHTTVLCYGLPPFECGFIMLFVVFGFCPLHQPSFLPPGARWGLIIFWMALVKHNSKYYSYIGFSTEASKARIRHFQRQTARAAHTAQVFSASWGLQCKSTFSSMCD